MNQRKTQHCEVQLIDNFTVNESSFEWSGWVTQYGLEFSTTIKNDSIHRVHRKKKTSLEQMKTTTRKLWTKAITFDVLIVSIWNQFFRDTNTTNKVELMEQDGTRNILVPQLGDESTWSTKSVKFPVPTFLCAPDGPKASDFKGYSTAEFINLWYFYVRGLMIWTQPSGSSVENPYDFNEHLRNCEFEDNEIMIHFDVEPMYIYKYFGQLSITINLGWIKSHWGHKDRWIRCVWWICVLALFSSILTTRWTNKILIDNGKSAIFICFKVLHTPNWDWS